MPLPVPPAPPIANVTKTRTLPVPPPKLTDDTVNLDQNQSFIGKAYDTLMTPVRWYNQKYEANKKRINDILTTEDIKAGRPVGTSRQEEIGMNAPILPDINPLMQKIRNRISPSTFKNLGGSDYSSGYLQSLGLEAIQTPYNFIRDLGMNIGTPGPKVNWSKTFENTKPLNLLEAPAVKPKQLALPPGRDPYIAGTGGVQKQSLLSPNEEARLAGYTVPTPNPSPVTRTSAFNKFTDLNQVREAERTKNLYTGHEQQGGSFLEVPDKPHISLPVQSGDTRLGFQPQTNAELPYPLNIVPNAVRPRSAQTMTRALTGDVAPLEVKPKVEFGNELPVKLNNEPTLEVKDPTRSIEFGKEPITSSAPIKPLKKDIKTKLESAKIAPTVATKVEASSNPVITKIANDFAAENASPTNPLATIGTRLKSSGSSGVELFRRSARAVQEERFNIEDWSKNLVKTGKKLSKNELDNFGDYVEGTTPIPNERVRNAVNAWKESARSAGTAAEEAGVTMEGGEPFKKLGDDYWHRALTPEQIEALPSKLEQLMKKHGISRAEADLILKRSKERGELILPEQKYRKGVDFEYKKDFQTGLAHLKSMAKRVATTKNLGSRDIMSDDVNALINSTSNPDNALELMKRLTGRDAKANKRLTQAVSTAREAISWMRLQNYGISSIIGNQLPNMLATDAKTYLGSLRRAVMRDKELGRISDESAAILNYTEELFDSTRKLTPMKVYGGEAAENFVRGQAAWIGRANARNYLSELQKNPNNVKAKKALFELVLEKDMNSVIKQKTLTEAQLRMAAGRQAEISQGLTNPMNLPKVMSQPLNSGLDAAGQIALIFKKQATIQTKMLKDAFKKNPIKTAAIITGFSQLAGGTIGAAKSAIKGATKGALSGKDIGKSISEEIEGRSDYLSRYGVDDKHFGKHAKEVRKAIDRTLQSWTLGLASDMLFWALDKDSFIEGIAGPVYGAAADIAGNVTKPRQLGKELLRMAPLPGGIGSAASEVLLPPKKRPKKSEFSVSLD